MQAVRSIRWEADALLQLDGIVRYISERNQAAAKKLYNEVVSRIELLRTFPELGRIGRAPGSREMVIHANYIVVYAVRENTIDIVRVLHVRQKYP